MLFDDLTRDGESETDAAKKVIAALFEVIEPVEDARQVFRWDPDAMVFHRDQDFFTVRAQVDADIPAARTELDGVVDQRHEGALKRFWIARNRRQGLS